MSKLSPGEVESLNQLRKVSGTGGFKNLTGTGAHASLTGYAVVVQEDTVFTGFDVDSVDKMSSYGLASVTLKAGAYLPAPKGSVITGLRMSSGSCVIYML